PGASGRVRLPMTSIDAGRLLPIVPVSGPLSLVHDSDLDGLASCPSIMWTKGSFPEASMSIDRTLAAMVLLMAARPVLAAQPPAAGIAKVDPSVAELKEQVH